MKRLTVLLLVGYFSNPVSLAAQVNPRTDFFGGVSALTIGGDAIDASRRRPIGWQASASQKINDTPLSLVGDFGGQFRTLENGSKLHVYEYLGGLRARAGRILTVAPGTRRIERWSVFAHALLGGSTQGGATSPGSSFTMAYGGGLDVMQKPQGEAYAFGVRTQFDWLPARANDTWVADRFRIAIGVVWMARYWD
jgi:hypothetical protein